MPILRQIAQLGHPVLRDEVAPVTFPITASIQALVDDMAATMRDAGGVGIAAPQIFASVAIFIVASRPNARYPDAPAMEPEVVINPRIVERSTQMVKDWEGCLSIPGLRGVSPATRPSRCDIKTSLVTSLSVISATSLRTSFNTKTTIFTESFFSTGSKARAT